MLKSEDQTLFTSLDLWVNSKDGLLGMQVLVWDVEV